MDTEPVEVCPVVLSLTLLGLCSLAWCSPCIRPHGSEKVRKGVALDHWWTALQNHYGLSCQMLGQQSISDIERLSKALETVAAAIH